MVYTVNGEQLTRQTLVKIDGSKVTTETGIPLMLRLNLPNVKAAGADVRLAKLDGTPLAREIEWKWYNDDVALHFPFDTVAGVDSQFWVYWGNSNLAEPAADSAYGSQAVWDSNYKFVSHMVDITSTTIRDSTGTVSDGTKAGTNPVMSDSTYGKRQYFSNGYIDFPSHNYFGTSNNFNILLQMNPASSQADYAMPFDCDIGTALEDGFNCQQDGANLNLYAMRWVDTGGAYSTAVKSQLSSNVESIFSSRKLGTTQYNYLNCVADGSISVSDDMRTGSNVLRIGRRIVTSIQYVGYISELRVSDIARTANYTITTHKNLNNPTATGTTPFYKSIGIPQHQNIGPQFQN